MFVSHLNQFLPPDGGISVAIGFFDGVHAGHRSLIELCRKSALPSAVFTFRNHPKSTLSPENAPAVLNRFEERMELLSETGVEYLIWSDFTPEFAALSAADFIRNVLIGALSSKKLFCGFNFRFGNGALGTPEFLKMEAAKYGVSVDVAEQFSISGERVSSSAIREYLQAGNIEAVNRMLQHNYFMHISRFDADRSEAIVDASGRALLPNGKYLTLLDGERAVVDYMVSGELIRIATDNMVVKRKIEFERAI